MYSIGEFSRITGLTVKTLRFYQEQGVLAPSVVDAQTGYRYYAESKVETARVITQLRRLEFSLADIAAILASFDDESDILEYLRRQRGAVRERLRTYRRIDASLDRIIAGEMEARSAITNATYQVEEKTVGPLLIAGVRMKGKYAECGRAFAQIGRRLGRHVCGKAMLLHYDREYKEDDADFEACLPVRKRVEAEGIDVRELPGGRCVTLLHRGPYDELGRSYARILDYVREKGLTIQSPTREVYIKGPGMIFKGNPRKYLTEIQMLVEG